MIRHILPATVVLMTSLAAQAPIKEMIKVGDPAPAVEADVLLNCPYGGITALQGKLVLYVWFLPESPSSRKLARSLNPLALAYRSQGFEVVAISHRDLEQIERWVKRRKPRFIVAWESSNISMGSYPFQQWPSSALVNPRGRVVHKGTPGQISAELIKKHLRGARGRGPDSPLRLALDLPSSLSGVSRDIEEGRLSKALAGLEKCIDRPASPDLREAAEQARLRIRNLLRDRREEAEDAVAVKRYFEAKQAYDRIVAHAPGTREAKQAQEVLAAFAKDATIQTEIRGGKILQDAENALDRGKEKRARTLLKKLTAGQWKGTAAGKRGTALLESLLPAK